MAAKEKTEKRQEITVEDRLKSLYKLQSVLSKIDDIRTLRGELPLEVQDLEDEIEGLNSRIAKQEEDITFLSSEINKWKEKKINAQAIVERSQGHIDDVRNNREYDALTKEIEYQTLEIELCDKKIREATESKENKQNIINESTINRTNLISDLEIKRAELEEIISDTRVEEEQLRAESKLLEERIDPRLLLSFKRIRKNSRNGLGIVYVQRDACGGCFNKIPPQRQLDVRMRKKVIVCEYCGRILIDPELAGVEVVKAESSSEKKAKTTKRSIKGLGTKKLETKE